MTCRSAATGHWDPDAVALLRRSCREAPLSCTVAQCPYVGCADSKLHSRQLFAAYADMTPWRAELARIELLSERGAEVLTLLGNGCSNRDIARRLGITERTAKFHVAQVLNKLRVASRLQAGIVAQIYRSLCGMVAANG